MLLPGTAVVIFFGLARTWGSCPARVLGGAKGSHDHTQPPELATVSEPPFFENMHGDNEMKGSFCGHLQAVVSHMHATWF